MFSEKIIMKADTLGYLAVLSYVYYEYLVHDMRPYTVCILAISSIYTYF